MRKPVCTRTLHLTGSLVCSLFLACAPGADTHDAGVDAGAANDGGNAPPIDAGEAIDSGSQEDGGAHSGECASAIALSCNSGMATFDTANGANAIDGYGSCDALFTDDYTGKELVFAFTNAEAAKVTIDARKSASGSTTYRLNLLDGNPCAGAFECLASQENTLADAPGAPLVFDVAAGETTYLAYDVRLFDETTPFTLEVSCAFPVCGDGAVEGNEQCDDGNTATGDGCDSACQIESGYVCRPDANDASDCYPIACGDGKVDGSETCDDGDLQPNDGCSATCSVEPSFTCSGEPSSCTQGGGTCESPVPLSAGQSLDFSTEGAASEQSNYGQTCPYHDYAGPEIVHRIDVPAGQALRAKLSSGDDFPARVVISNACGSGQGCQGYSVAGAAWVNRGSETASMYVIVDGWFANSTGDYTLETDVLAPAQFPAGDLCDTAIALVPPQTVSGSTANFVNSISQYGGQCGFVGVASRSGVGRDSFYSVRVPAGQTLRAELSAVEPSIDVTLSLLNGCDGVPGNCLTDVDTNSAGAGETLVYTNGSGSEAVYILAIDAISADAAHSYSLSVSLE